MGVGAGGLVLRGAVTGTESMIRDTGSLIRDPESHPVKISDRLKLKGS